MALKPITVSQLNDYISRVLMTDPLLGNLTVTGEISNLKYHSSGHLYFSITDQNSKVNCFFPAQYVRGLHYALGDGLEVVIHGYLNVYKKGGTYTLFVRSIEIAGAGGLAAAFQLLKEKLAKEKGISDGTNPNGTINRAQMVTMLWRAMGQPAAASGASFADVPADSYYAQAVAWAIENGITAGVGGGRFDPNSTCTRGQIATFLWRAMAE